MIHARGLHSLAIAVERMEPSSVRASRRSARSLAAAYDTPSSGASIGAAVEGDPLLSISGAL